jgi:hypothetical protein
MSLNFYLTDGGGEKPSLNSEHVFVRICMRVPTYTRSADCLRLYSVPMATNIYNKPIESAVDHVCSLLGSLYRGIKEPPSKQKI